MNAAFLTKGFLFLFIFLMINSCICTKKGCEGSPRPEVVLVFKNFSAEDLEHIVIYKTNQAMEVKDSIVYGSFYNNYTLTLQDIDCGYIVKTGASRDTIHDVLYTRYEETVECNGCIPFGHKDVTTVNYKDFSYVHEGASYYDSDTLKITK